MAKVNHPHTYALTQDLSEGMLITVWFAIEETSRNALDDQSLGTDRSTLVPFHPWSRVPWLRLPAVNHGPEGDALPSGLLLEGQEQPDATSQCLRHSPLPREHFPSHVSTRREVRAEQEDILRERERDHAHFLLLLHVVLYC